ncbi:hypothetical protein ACI7YU_18870 [Pseudomonas siliginis]|uniref:hypothetical protein n=1 Tax=Pseudomonas siliginis TaxID=2842346 RepID=UPI0038680716
MSKNDEVGRIGEAFIQYVLQKPVFGSARFKVTPLGEKYQLFDFMVNLLDNKSSMSGPFFLLQVKTHEVASLSDAINIEFTAVEVMAAKERMVPSYLVGVQTCGRDQRGYFIALDRDREAGVYSVPKRHSMDSEPNMKSLYEEVGDFFASSVKNQFESMFS